MDVLADRNVILRRLHRTDPKHRFAREAILKLGTAGHRVCIASQNLIELWAVCTRPAANNGFGLTSGQADRILAHVESSVFRLPDSDEIYGEWRRLVVAHGVSAKKTHDARLVAAMIVYGVSHILTFNVADFIRYSGITVLDPSKT